MAMPDFVDYMLGLDPYDFQGLVASLLNDALKWKLKVGPQGPDGAVDLAGVDDHGRSVLAQVKQHLAPSTVVTTPSGIQTWLESLDGRWPEPLLRTARKVFITTGTFSEAAEAYAADVGVETVDGGTLVDLARGLSWVKRS